MRLKVSQRDGSYLCKTTMLDLEKEDVRNSCKSLLATDIQPHIWLMLCELLQPADLQASVVLCDR